nr:hypothetical protein [Tanacetum cinerariifolium]
GKPVTCSACEGMLKGGFCLHCNLKADNCYQNAYSFDDASNNSNYLSQPQYENYLCNLCGNNSHDVYDCQQQFPLVYEQELSYNQNCNGNNYPHESPSFPCCDNCGGSHETFECQPMDQNINFSGSDQIQTPQYPDVHPPSQEISEEVFQAKGDLMKSIQIFLEKFNCIPFEEKPKILLQAWYKFFTIQHAKPEDSNELFQKLLEDLKELAEYGNSPRKPPQDSDIRKLIREECCVEVCEEQKQKMEDTILELVEICRQKEFLCMHDNVDDLIESALNSKLLSLNSQRLNKEKQEVKNVMEQPAERRTQPEYSTSMGEEHPNTTPEMESDKIIKSGVEELVPILNEKEVSLEDKRKGDVPVCENSPICDNHSEIFPNSKNDDDISSDDDDFEDIKYVDASLSDPEIVSVAEEIVVYQEEEEEKLINVVKNDIPDDSTNDPLLEEADLFLAFDNSIPPGIENFGDDSEGDIRFLEALLSDDSIPFPNNESSESDFNNLSVLQPPQEQPDADFEPDSGNEISVVMKNNDKLKCLNPRDEFYDDDYLSFMFVIYSKKFLSFLSAESEDTIFDPGIAIYPFYSFKPGLSHRCGTFKKFNTYRSHLNEIPMEMLFSTCFPSDQ